MKNRSIDRHRQQQQAKKACADSDSPLHAGMATKPRSQKLGPKKVQKHHLLAGNREIG
jgi:hypothetical protein